MLHSHQWRIFVWEERPHLSLVRACLGLKRPVLPRDPKRPLWLKGVGPARVIASRAVENNMEEKYL